MKRYEAPEPSSSDSESCAKPVSKRHRGPSRSGSDVDIIPEKGRSELLLTHLAMFPGEEAQCESMAASNGKSKQRIKSVLNKSLCNCSKKCYNVVTLTMVFQVCLTFWNLTKAAQDCVLWGIQNMSNKSPATQKDSQSSDDSECESESESDASGTDSHGSMSTSESGSGSSTSIKQMNNWYIQGWDHQEFFISCHCVFHQVIFKPLFSRHPFALLP